jgi:hypothetical protein
LSLPPAVSAALKPRARSLEFGVARTIPAERESAISGVVGGLTAPGRPGAPPARTAWRAASLGPDREDWHVRNTTGTRRDHASSAQPAGRSLWEGVASKARCADSVLDPDEWFPVSPRPEIARARRRPRYPSA